MPGRPGKLVVQEFKHVSAVREAGQWIAKEFAFIIFDVIDLGSGKITVDMITDANVVAVDQFVAESRLIVDEGAVGALQVDQCVSVDARLNARVVTRDGRVIDANVAIDAPAHNDWLIHESEPTSRSGTGWKGLYQAS